MSMKKYILFVCLIIFKKAYTKTFSIMLDPAGDAKHTGRVIDDSFERGLTLQFCEQLKKNLEKEYGTKIRIVLSRLPGETLEPLQNASFANRLNVDFYLSIHFFKEIETKPRIFLYYFAKNPVTDFWHQSSNQLSFYAYDQAYLINIKDTKNYVLKMKESLEEYSNQFNLIKHIGIPFKPIVGIKSPTIAIEIGLKNKEDWKKIVEPISKSLSPIIKSYYEV